MWLVYLRFDGKGQTRVSHSLCYSQEDARDIIADFLKSEQKKDLVLNRMKRGRTAVASMK